MHTYTKSQIPSVSVWLRLANTWSVEDTKLSTNKQHTHSLSQLLLVVLFWTLELERLGKFPQAPVRVPDVSVRPSLEVRTRPALCHPGSDILCNRQVMLVILSQMLKRLGKVPQILKSSA